MNVGKSVTLEFDAVDPKELAKELAKDSALCVDFCLWN